MLKTSAVLIMFFLLPLTFRLSAQQYNFRNYTVKDGVAQSQVYALLQDHRGYLWMGTRGGGLTRYDGNRFTTFSERDGLPSSYIHKIREDKYHNLWIATNKGISHYNGLKFTNYYPDGYDNPVWVYDISIDEKGRKWLATNVGVLLFDKGKFTSVSRMMNEPETIITTILSDSKQRIWYGTGKGLFRIIENGGRFTRVRLSDQSRYMGNAITVVKEDPQGNIWIGTYGDGAYRYDGYNYSRIDFNKELYTQTVLDIYPDNKGNVWFGTLIKGIVQYNTVARSFSFLSEKEGLSNNHVRSIAQDNSGSMWIGTSGGGVCHYFGKQFTTYDKSSGLGGNFIYSIFRDSRQQLWIGTSQKGLSMLDQSRFTTFSAENGFADVKVKCIAEDDAGALYFGTDGQGVYKYDGQTFAPLKRLEGTYVRAMLNDKQGNIWMATAGSGLFRVTPKDDEVEIDNYLVADGLLQNRLTSLLRDRRGRIWYGTENNGIGAVAADGSMLTERIRVKEGLLSNVIRCLAEDRSGNMWIGTAGSGVAVVPLYKGRLIPRCFDHTGGLTSSNIYLLTVDAGNRILAGSETGLDHLQLDGNRLKILRHYGSGEGFTGIETCQNAVWNDSDGSIWFGTINGLSHYNPAQAVRNKYEPITSVTDVRLFYESLSKTRYANFLGDWNSVRSLNLPYDQNHLSFDFLGVNFSNPTGVRYRWKLEGFDERWSPVSSEQSIVYSNLNPGNYTFLLRAANEDGVWNKVPVSIPIFIAPPFWYRWWFITLVILVFLGLITAGFTWQTRRIRAKSEETRRQLQMAKEMVELEQKALRLQMNPHFIFNALNSIQSQIGTGKEQEARYYLAKFSRLMRQILDNSRNPVISLEEEVSTLENYLLIEQFCNGNRFDYTIEVDPDIEQDFVKLPPMILQPFVENAIKHGFRFGEDESGKRGHVAITFKEEGNVLVCSVSDNGIGRERSAELNRNSMETYHKSTAMLVTQERLDLMRETEGESSLEMIDRKDENGKALGTTVVVRVAV